MITNKTITYYSKGLDNTKLETWTKTIFSSAWVYQTKGSIQNAGYENANEVEIRIPIKYVKDTSIFKVGDIIAIGKQSDITKQSDLNGIEFYNVTSVNINDFGSQPHIHLGGK